MEEVSPFAAAYKHMHQVEKEENCCANAAGTEPSKITMFYRRGKDQRRYNEPRHDEVAAVFVGEEDAPPWNCIMDIHMLASCIWYHILPKLREKLVNC